jgi:hypothetical protein
MSDFLDVLVKALGATIALSTVLGGLGKFLIFDPLRREIREATRPIQPTANGGLSLPDVAKKLDAMEEWRQHTDQKLDLMIELLHKK